MPIAFLNRFEKQLISYRTSLPPETLPWISVIKDLLCEIFKTNYEQLGKLFCGFNDDTIPSALSNVLAQKKEEQKGKFDFEKTGQTEFLSFEKVVNLQRSESNKQMALILTGDFECSLPEKWGDNTKKIESFKKSSEFEQIIDHFFSPKNTIDNLLILQYVYDHKNFSQFMHIKHTLEHAHHRYYRRNEEEEEEKEKSSVGQKLVVLLVHMKQPICKDPFPLLFSRKWKLMYVDNLSSAESMQFKTLLTQTMSDVIQMTNPILACAMHFVELLLAYNFLHIKMEAMRDGGCPIYLKQLLLMNVERQ
ncbi:hypothetical protein RFI_30798 [Reticulomyxa filosa]|uniref:Uncharacterized protein n=1 Tax=Reticulomyxa filosa TaxID=46433 RepID=X6M0T9_RETFI|nr:hypothetical protein RFI_30798 [Reticulomyxa filosa]|eukprot:ETO06595.1 hypothetical protein RFI_30798 [Reticulomyxa filosa]